MWGSMVKAWLNVRPGLLKSDPASAAEILRQPIFGNPSILSPRGLPLGVSGFSEGRALAHAGCLRIKNMWCERSKDWKSLEALGLSYHPANRDAWETITNSIPWRPDDHVNQLKEGDWVTKPTPGSANAPDWVYMVFDSSPTTARVLEFKKTELNGHLQAPTCGPITIVLRHYCQVRVLLQDYPGSTFKIAREPPDPRNKHRIYWIFEAGFIHDLPWDPGEWHWAATPPWAMRPSSDTRPKEAIPTPGKAPNLQGCRPSSKASISETPPPLR
jgi:hypothetical protein